ncbi:hypothetical protein TorRG33x02_043450, partial [Trema orientale]
TIPSSLGSPACEKDAKVLQLIEDMTQNPDSVQERVLREILILSCVSVLDPPVVAVNHTASLCRRRSSLCFLAI